MSVSTASPATVLDGIEDVRAAVGTTLGVSEWLSITQDRIDAFADATGDHQWIHVDPDLAAADSPYGTTIAHGYLSLSLTNHFLPQIVEIRGFAMGLNYGTNKVRFPAPVPAGARVRGRADLTSVTDVPGGIQTAMTVTIEIDGHDKPACAVEVLSRYLTPTSPPSPSNMEARPRSATPAVEGWFTTGDEPALVGQRCGGCGATVFPPLAATCPNPACRSDELDAVTLARTGTVWSWATNHYAPPPPFVAGVPFEPFTVVAVTLDGEDLTVLGQLDLDVDPAGLEVGTRVEVTVGELFRDGDGPRSVYRFRPVVSS